MQHKTVLKIFNEECSTHFELMQELYTSDSSFFIISKDTDRPNFIYYIGNACTYSLRGEIEEKYQCKVFLVDLMSERKLRYALQILQPHLPDASCVRISSKGELDLYVGVNRNGVARQQFYDFKKGVVKDVVRARCLDIPGRNHFKFDVEKFLNTGEMTFFDYSLYERTSIRAKAFYEALPKNIVVIKQALRKNWPVMLMQLLMIIALLYAAIS